MGSQDTFLGWPRLITPATAPAPFAGTLARLTDAGAATLIFNPEFAFDVYRSSAKVVAWWPDRVALLDADAGGALVAELFLAEVSRIEWGQALLTTWVALEGTGPRGPGALRVDFNSTYRELYDPLLAALRTPRYPAPPPDWRPPPLDALAHRDYRFASFTRMALPPGAEVRDLHREGTVRRRRAGGLEVERIPAFVLVRTQSELVLIVEGDGARQGPYAATWVFLAIDRIASASVEVDAAADVARLRVRLHDGALAGCDAPASAADALRSVLEGVRRDAVAA